MPSAHDPERDAHGCVPQCPVRLLAEQAGPRPSGGYPPEGGQRSHVATYGKPNERGEQRFSGSTGSASRFFPVFYPAAPDEGEGPAMAGQGPLRAEVRCGDARDVLATLPDASVDAVVTDPPYALTDKQGGAKGFMGARWDTGQVAHDPAFWAEVLRVAKPGAFLLAFGGTRTYHRLACAIEDAGWECRDMIMWHYGSGFPKSTSCLKPSHEPIVLAKAPGPLQPLQIDASRVALDAGVTRAARQRTNTSGAPGASSGGSPARTACASAPSKPAGRWPPNTLLSHHPDCQPAGVRRVRTAYSQPMERTTSPSNGVCYSPAAKEDKPVGYADADGYETVDAYQCVDGCPIKALDEQAGPPTRGSSTPRQRTAPRYSGTYNGGTVGGAQDTAGGYDDAGGPSRFFPTFGPDPQDAVPFRYVSKASRAERSAGLDDVAPTRSDYRPNDPDENSIRTRLHGSRAARNPHPTVKPLALMQWLVRLVTPPDGVVLDPFCGSGSTGVACAKEGFGFIGIEMSEEYAAIARARIAHEQEQHAGPLFAGVGTATTAAR